MASVAEPVLAPTLWTPHASAASSPPAPVLAVALSGSCAPSAQQANLMLLAKQLKDHAADATAITCQLQTQEQRQEEQPLALPAAEGEAPLRRAPKAAAPEGMAAGALTADAILAKRRRFLGPNLATFFPEAPLHITSARGCLLFDEHGDSYLDCINNVSHCGHAHPAVAEAVSRQLCTLNTNSRYLGCDLVMYAERLQATLPDPLEVVYMVCSGSEANELAWRIACTAARRAGAAEPLHVAVMDHAYHGHTNLCIDLSPYKFNGPGGGGCPAYVHVLPCPDVLRGHHLDGAAAARAAIAAARAAGGRIAAFFAESIISCGGQVVLPQGYLASVYAEMRGAGAVCIADEVQCGFGRVGAAFWAFELQGVVPDIVTCGKPMGNGFPMAGLITTPRLAEAFGVGGMEFFATAGGCNAAAACGLVVLDVIRREGLVANAARVGSHVKRRLRALQDVHPEVVGDVRGEGLMLGVELVTDAASRCHAPALARCVKQRCKQEQRVLLSTEGPYGNVIKIKPPICMTLEEADRMVDAMQAVLGGLSPEERQALAEASRQEVAALALHRCTL